MAKFIKNVSILDKSDELLVEVALAACLVLSHGVEHLEEQE